MESLQPLAAAEAFFARQTADQLTLFVFYLRLHVQYLNSWNVIMRNIQEFSGNGDSRIVLDGSPGVRHRGRFTANNAHVACRGEVVPKRCRITARKADFFVSSSKEKKTPFTGRMMGRIL